MLDKFLLWSNRIWRKKTVTQTVGSILKSIKEVVVLGGWKRHTQKTRSIYIFLIVVERL